MPNRQPRGATGEAAIGNECAGFSKPLGFEVAGGVEHLLHAGPAAWPLITNNDHIPCLHAVLKNVGYRRLLAVTNVSRTGELE